jgi:hypothetical protein
MDYFSATVLVTPIWIASGGLAVLFTRRLVWLYLSICVLLAGVSWLSGVAQVREQRSFAERQMAVQQQLDAEFEKIAIALRIPPDSPHEMILNHMHAMDTNETTAAPALIGTPLGNKCNQHAPK